ncbi:uncharacterized protein ACRADG_002566 [Cochliomyia hominivorax]
MSYNYFKQLCIYKSRYVNILTHNTRDDQDELEETQITKFALNHKECIRFLKIEAQNIEILKIHGDNEKEQLKLEHVQMSVKPFAKLTKLIYYQMAMTNEDLFVISQSCKRLQSLHIIKCYCEHFQDLVPGINININYVCNITQLEELKFENANVAELKLKYVQRLLSGLKKLSELDLRNFYINCKDGEQSNRISFSDKVRLLEILNMGFITPTFWCTFTDLLKCCPLLRALTISSRENEIVIKIKLIDILSKCCKHLKTLSLEKCHLEVEDFQPLQELEELNIISCTGFHFVNLQQVLGGLKLKTFKLINTEILNICNFIYISPSLETLTIDTINYKEISEIFQNTLNNFSQLKTLNWYKGDISHNWIKDKCPQLQSLNIINPYSLPRFMFSLKSLKELKLSSCHGLSWGLLKILICNLSLKHLEINTDKVVIDKRISEEYCKLKTDLEYLRIPYEIFIMRVRYWLDMLDINENLRMVIYGKSMEILNVRLMCLLLSEECVQMRIKRLKICGLNLVLRDFSSKSILMAFAYLHMNTQIYRSRNSLFTLEL